MGDESEEERGYKPTEVKQWGCGYDSFNEINVGAISRQFDGGIAKLVREMINFPCLASNCELY